MSYHVESYHVRLGKKRTSVTLDTLIASLLALKLDQTPETPEARAAVRTYLQDILNQADDPGRYFVSQWLRKQVLLKIADSKLVDRYWKWFGKSK